MHLGLSHSPNSFQDGSGSWNGSAADAIAIWNQYLNKIQFLQAGSVANSGGDGNNSVFFSKTVYGQTFGSQVLAITLSFSGSGPIFTETDVIFNDNRKWSSYRGALQFSGNSYTYDFHRVALHEFGHVLGLDHPDEHGQSIDALMNSIISDRDSLADDDIAGVRSLYASPPLSAALGSDFTYQVTSGNNPSSFACSDLPPGLSLNANTGVISGVPTISGSYTLHLTAFSSSGTVTLILQITVTTPSSTGDTVGTLLRTFPLKVAQLTADPTRPRVYATVPGSNTVAVIDTTTLAITTSIPVGSDPFGLSVSADGSKLWVANRGANAPAISVIDLANLAPLPGFDSPQPAYQVEEGPDGRLYATGTSSFAPVIQIDTKTGQAQNLFSGFNGFISGYGLLKTSPDRHILYFAAAYGGYLAKLDISTPSAVMLQGKDVASNGQDLALSHDGQFVVYPGGGGNTGYPAYSSAKIKTTDLNLVTGSFAVGPYPTQVVFSNDDSVLFHAVDAQSKVALFDAKTFTPLNSIPLGSNPNSSGGYNASDLTLDRTGALLFVATNFYPQNGDLRIYSTGGVGSTAPPQATPRPKSLLNVSTRLRSQTGDNVLIGGFVLTGSAPKKVVVRALGPSLPLTGNLADPQIELRASDGSLVAQNDNWNSHRADVLNSNFAPKNEHESAIVAALNPGAYTAIVRGLNDSTGVALVELYDLNPESSSRIVNISTRGRVETGDNVMIGGFIIGGDQPTRVAVRALGPSLATYGVSGPLPNPTVTLYNSTGTATASNDDWQSEQAQEIIDAHQAPADPREAAFIRTLSPGAYTAIVSGKDGSSGVALVEVFNLESN